MPELERVSSESMSDNERLRSTLLLVDESDIRCNTLTKLSEVIGGLRLPVILAMPDNEYVEGRRGYVKAKILAAVTPTVRRIVSLSYDQALKEIAKPWGEVRISGEFSWVKQDVLKGNVHDAATLDIVDTDDPFDKLMMTKAKSAVSESNCWMDPAGSVFTRNGEILVVGVSTNFNHSDCKNIPINFSELTGTLVPGERMFFCDSLHSERVGIATAARDGISLDGSTMYVTKFPCRSCSQDAIAAGVKTIVFERGSYGLIETADLFQDKSIGLKRVVG